MLEFADRKIEETVATMLGGGLYAIDLLPRRLRGEAMLRFEERRGARQ